MLERVFLMVETVDSQRRRKMVSLTDDILAKIGLPTMLNVKDTLRAVVNIAFDGRVYKTFRGPNAQERYTNEVAVLRHLEAQGCTFVPRLLEANPEELRIVTSNCGSRVDHLDPDRIPVLFGELEQYGVRHEDQDIRNVTYRQSDGRFCLIDFEFASILHDQSIH